MDWWRFTGCGHVIEGRIMELEYHCIDFHETGEVFTFQMRHLVTDELVTTFEYTAQ